MKHNNFLFHDYDGFVEKFKPKKTTDDCFTPPEVYDAVLDWLAARADLAGKEIVRCFYPGMDYKTFDYPDGCVVVDNPPFSILAEILRNFDNWGVRYFLFAPHLTLFSTDSGNTRTHIVVDFRIRYDNGALVNTGFITNLPEFSKYRIIGSYALKRAIEEVQKTAKEKDKKILPVYKYPDNLVTVSSIANIINAGIDLVIRKKTSLRTRMLDSQKKYGKAIFGSGYLVSDGEAEKLKAEKLKAEKLKAEKLKEAIVFDLSSAEKEVIKHLNQYDD